MKKLKELVITASEKKAILFIYLFILMRKRINYLPRTCAKIKIKIVVYS